MTKDKKQIIDLEERVSLLMQQIAELQSENIMLRNRLSIYETKKDSSNSSLPPSRDLNRLGRTESLREKSGKKAGGQIGHSGSFLQMVSNPTEIIELRPCYCQSCGKDLSDTASDYIGRRQLIDIPPIKPVIKEYHLYSKQCNCGHITSSQYPSEVNSSVCYGNNIQGLTAYFHARQYIPYERMQELYSDVFGLSISSGCLVKMIQTFANKATGIYEIIARRVSQSLVIGADETGNRMNGKNGWAWVFQTPDATYIHSDKSRGRAVIDKLFPNGFTKSILVHDCYSSYFSIKTKEHQICIAHLLRDLKYIGKLYPDQQWITNFTNLLHQALELKKNLSPQDYSQTIPQRIILEKNLDDLLEQKINYQYEKLITFKERILRYRKHLFTFLYYQKVPPDNNASERAVRTFKVKQKVSGLFRSDKGSETFAIIRSIIDTTIK